MSESNKHDVKRGCEVKRLNRLILPGLTAEPHSRDCVVTQRFSRVPVAPRLFTHVLKKSFRIRKDFFRREHISHYINVVQVSRLSIFFFEVWCRAG
jgi:hypothetical protein